MLSTRVHLSQRAVGTAVFVFLVLGRAVGAQDENALERARAAIEEGNFYGVIEILTPEIAANPSPDAYLMLGLAHANVSQYDRSLELFTQAARLYPADSRFHDEIAGVHMANRDVDLAVEALERALEVDPGDRYASDLLGSIRLSVGDVKGALEVWNAVEQPEIADVGQNFSPGFLDRVVPQSLAFASGDVLTYGQWRTTRARLFATELYSNVGLDLEPSSAPQLYDAIVRTSPRTNSRSDILFDLFRGLPIESTYLDIWDIGYSGVSWRSHYRWDNDRRRLRGQLFVPLPLPGLPVVELQDVWRSENWNLAEPIRDEFSSSAAFQYKVNSLALNLRFVPHYRVELAGGFEYRNRDALGSVPVLGMDERNSAMFTTQAVIRFLDGRYKNQLRFDGFLARESVLGDFDFSGGSLELANRFVLDLDSSTFIDWSVTGGTARGDVPIDHYFILGLGSVAQHPLRGHVASDSGIYGRAPMGTDFVLVNSDIERRLTTIPLFNALSIPYIEVKAMGFFDVAKTFDRHRVFQQGRWLRDVGAGLTFDTPTMSYSVLYGRDIDGGVNTFYGYVEREIW